jgi:clan AA aspartic protease (TIGR02281 family)
MLKRSCLVALLTLSALQGVGAGYLDENPDEVFAEVYQRLGIGLPVRIARDPYVWLRLEELKREPCDQTSVNDLALFLEKLGRRREAAEGLYNFVRHCGAPHSALHKSVDMLLKLTDHAKAVEVADEFVRRAPANHDAHYLRAVALQGTGDFRRALVDYANAVELVGTDRRKIGARVFLGMAEAYAALGRFCEAVTPVLTWVALDPVNRDTSRSQKLVADYEARGNCAAGKQAARERYPLRGQKHVVTVKAEVNGARGVFILDTGASYVTVKSTFAARAKVPQADAQEITIATANGLAKGKLAKADKVRLGSLEAANVPVVVQATDASSYGAGVDGLLGMSFLSRFDLQMAGGFIEVRTRRPK